MELINNPLDRVTTKQAAVELNTTTLDIQESLIQGLIPIGFAQKRRGSTRYYYVIYRGLLEAYKKQIVEGRPPHEQRQTDAALDP